MAYSNYAGYLVKIGNYIIPFRHIKADTYKAYANMQDVEPWTDANGYLHREAVELKALKVEFEIPPMYDDEKFAEFMYNIDQNITIEKANQCVVTAFIPRYNKYFTQTGYLADIEPQMYFANEEKIKYDAMRFAFIGGVYDG